MLSVFVPNSPPLREMREEEGKMMEGPLINHKHENYI